MQCKHPQPVADTLVSANKSPKIPADQKVTIDSTKIALLNQLITHKAETISMRQVQDKNREQSCQPHPHFRSPPRLPYNLRPESPKTNTVTRMNIDVDFEENSPHQNGIISELYQRPDKTYFQELKDLESLVNTSNLVQKFLPKQADIDKILKIIQPKVLKGSHLSVTVKEIQAGYLNSLYFKEIYLYLAHNELPSSKVGIHIIRLITIQNNYNTRQRNSSVRYTETCVDSIINLYHSKFICKTPRCN